jgi:hypothetical protein
MSVANPKPLYSYSLSRDIIFPDFTWEVNFCNNQLTVQLLNNVQVDLYISTNISFSPEHYTSPV